MTQFSEQIHDHLYILDGTRPRRATSFAEWAAWEQDFDPGIALAVIDDITISTVFLTRDMGHGSDACPRLFETGVFGPEGTLAVRRYHSLKEAILGHRDYVIGVAEDIRGERHDAHRERVKGGA